MPRGTVTCIRYTSSRSYVFYLLSPGITSGSAAKLDCVQSTSLQITGHTESAVTRCVSRVIHRFFRHTISFAFFIFPSFFFYEKIGLQRDKSVDEYMIFFIVNLFRIRRELFRIECITSATTSFSFYKFIGILKCTFARKKILFDYMYNDLFSDISENILTSK